MIRAGWSLLLVTASLVFAQSRTMTQGRHRMEITLERLEKSGWRRIDPGLMLDQNDRVRFRYKTNFDGYLYVTNLSSSGDYHQLFPGPEAGDDNQVASGKEYLVPATSTVFRVTGPAGYETVYWLVTPSRIKEGTTHLPQVPPNAKATAPIHITPRCDDSIMRARGECLDTSAGPKLVPRDLDLPPALAQAAGESRRDLLFMRQDEKAVISSPDPLTGPVIYEFRLAHR